VMLQMFTFWETKLHEFTGAEHAAELLTRSKFSVFSGVERCGDWVLGAGTMKLEVEVLSGVAMEVTRSPPRPPPRRSPRRRDTAE